MSNAIVQVKQRPPLEEMLHKMKPEIIKALPKHLTADRMLRVALTEFRRTPSLYECDANSVLGALMQCAQLGLEPGGILGQAYLIPFFNNNTKRKEAQLVIGYKGFIELAWRSGQLKSLEARLVYKADVFKVTYGLQPTIDHEPCLDENSRGDVIYAYAVANLKNGGVQFELMSKSELSKIQNASKSKTVWSSHWGEMAKKTVLRRLFKTLPMNVELATLAAIEDAGVETENAIVESVEMAEALEFATDGTNELAKAEPEITEEQRNELLNLVMGAELDARQWFMDKYKVIENVPPTHFENVVAAMRRKQVQS
jgi:recombination protein RecT